MSKSKKGWPVRSGVESKAPIDYISDQSINEEDHQESGNTTESYEITFLKMYQTIHVHTYMYGSSWVINIHYSDFKGEGRYCIKRNARKLNPESANFNFAPSFL